MYYRSFLCYIYRNAIFAVVSFAVSFGVKETFNICIPVLNRVTNGGVETKVPGTEAVAFS
jgi:hypothetical protein